ncbi:MAG: 30S ribosomal protein S8 [Patescibacteria group bacterium]
MDTIGNMLTIIRNGLAVKKETVAIPYSQLKLNILKILEKRGFIKKSALKGRKNKKIIDVALSYDKNKKPLISHLKRISKPSRRIYISANKIRNVQSGKGIWVISTSKGVFDDKEAKKNKLGGELICEIW